MRFPRDPMIAGIVVVVCTTILAVFARWERIVKVKQKKTPTNTHTKPHAHTHTHTCPWECSPRVFRLDTPPVLSVTSLLFLLLPKPIPARPPLLSSPLLSSPHSTPTPPLLPPSPLSKFFVFFFSPL